GSVRADPHRTVAEILFEHPAHLALIAAAALSLHFRGRLTAWIDRRFFREAYQQEQILLSLVEDIRARDSLADLSRLVIERLGQSLHPERVYLAYQRMDGRDFGIEFSSDGDAAGLQIADDAELIRRLETRPHAQELPAAEPDDAALRWLAELRVTLAVPMTTPAGRLVGCILLGEKKSEQPYSHAD